MSTPYFDRIRVAFLRLLSSVMAIWITTLSAAQAHEVLPSIADMRVVGDRVVFEVRANVESFVAGVDLAEAANTNDAAQAEMYDALRALEPGELQAKFEAFWPEMAERITLSADGITLLPVLDRIIVEPVGNVELVRSSVLQFSAELPDGAISVQMGWAPEFGVLVLRQMDVPAPYDGYLVPGAISDPILLAGSGQTSGWGTFVDYIPVGFDHILPKGLDHVLFVLGLFFLSTQLRPLVIQISLFTLAHTITLALAALGYVNVPANIVEPLIAASIVFVAVENIWAKGISRWRPYIIFAFGLLHGLGFASVLQEFGLPGPTFVAALIGFNIGVEIGQLAVIAIMFLCVWQALRIDEGENEVNQGFALYAVLLVIAIALAVLNPTGLQAALEGPVWLFAVPLALIFALSIMSIQFRDQVDAYRRFVAIPCSLAIAFIGAYWVIERVFL
ncbi:HupE/UreJ family protein [Cognatiyoonia sp. IB215446]|uniref:HupE/UreJ family protein n=1 Tax=Cognatiyoonia sp. IB215446 TaxID=3097355 RepID=UPI002A0F4485|nr:HupE/UreJ family protein [Cognatiyoonia sp. IB215446]MDX8348958.1 HupE/UreJ family protein [Cognatiyoonia sp. IB215446]